MTNGPQWSIDLQLETASSHPEWKANKGRVEDRESVEACVGEAIAKLSRTELETKLQGVPCAPVNTVLEALSDPQSVARGALTQHRGVDVLASPLRFMTPQNENKDV